MNNFIQHTAAAIAAVLIVTVSIGAVVTVPPIDNASGTAPVIAMPALA